MRYKALLIFVIVITSILTVPVHATVTIEPLRSGTIQTKIALSYYQNLTKFPTQTRTVDDTTDPSLKSTFAKSLKDAQTASQLTQVNVQVRSSDYWLNVTASLDIANVTTIRGDLLNASTTWKAFHVDADLRAGDFSYNTVGGRYLRPVYDYYINASRFVSRPNATITGVTFLSNQTSLGGNPAANLAGNLTLLDLRPLNVPLDQWGYRYNLENHTTTWRYSPLPLILASIKVSNPSGRTVTLISNFSYDATIIVTGFGRAKGNNVLVDIGSGQREVVMLIVVILSVAVAIWAQILYRRRRKKAIMGRR